MAIYANVYERDGASFTLRTRLECDSAEGSEIVNGIGYGKITVAHYANFSLPAGSRIQLGDVIFAWTNAPDGKVVAELDTVTDIHYITLFIVKSRNYKDGKYEVSGPDFIAELQDYVAIAPVGELAEVATTAVSLGTRTIWQTDPDTFEAWEAAYGSHAGTTQDITPYVEGKTKYGLLFITPIPMQVTDRLYHMYPDGSYFETTVAAVNDRYNYVELADPITRDIAAGAKVHITSSRLRVADASLFIEGSPIFYTPTPGPSLPTAGTIVVDRIELGDGDAPDYLYFADPIPHEIAAGATITQKQYTDPTTDDVDMLLDDSTFGEWLVWRGENTDTGTAYAPNAESVWDVLLAICDISGYHVRRLLYNIVTAVGTIAAPRRTIEYFVPGEPVVVAPPRADKVTSLGMEMQLSRTYGTLLNLEYEDSQDAVTHLIPYGGGGGSGRFSIKDARRTWVLEDYPGLNWGIVKGQYYIYNTAIDDRAAWATETFGHISPLDPSSAASRREAAEMLLRAGCDWLIARAEPDTTYRAEIFTNGEPRPGDPITIDWTGADPTPTTASDLIITEVRHVVTAETPYRITTLTMNAAGSVRKSGERMIARSILDLQRTIKHGNFGSNGDARITYDGMEFGGDGDVRSGTGDITLRSVAADVNIQAMLGDVNIDAQGITIGGATTVDGSLRVTNDLILPSESSNFDYALSVIEVRGVPRLRLTKQARGA